MAFFPWATSRRPNTVAKADAISDGRSRFLAALGLPLSVFRINVAHPERLRH